MTTKNLRAETRKTKKGRVGGAYHEIVGSPIRWLLIAAMVFFLILVLTLGDRRNTEGTLIVLLATSAILAAMAIIFGELEIEIDRDYLIMRFMFIKTRVKLSDIESCEKIKARWYMGLGVRTDFRNIAYFARYGDAVVVRLKGSKRAYAFSTRHADEVCRIIKASAGR